MKTVRALLQTKKMDQIISASPESTVLDALKLMAQGNFGALPVVSTTGDRRLLGIFSERDYARKVILLGKSSHTTLVSEIMTPNPICVHPDHTLEECMKLMTERGFRHLPVIENNQLVG